MEDADAVFDLCHPTQCYFHHNRQLPIRRRSPVSHEIDPGLELVVNIRAQLCSKCSLLICPVHTVHTPIRRRRGAGGVSQGGHVARRMSLYIIEQPVRCPRNIPCCIHLAEDYTEQAKTGEGGVSRTCFPPSRKWPSFCSRIHRSSGHWTPVSTQAHLILPIWAGCCPSILASSTHCTC